MAQQLRQTKLRQMTLDEADLYQRIREFNLDDPHSKLPFSQRLAKENGWSLVYTHRVIAEYKKFVFLAIVAGHVVSPSEPVDQVWHLHLTYTRSYWQEFCPHVLQTPLHHEPTTGGASETAKFADLYQQTLNSYRYFFGTIPPSDIWAKPEIRLTQAPHFQRINLDQNWLLPKPNFPKLNLSLYFLPIANFSRQTIKLSFFLTTVIATLFVTWQSTLAASNTNSFNLSFFNPAHLSGPDFINFYLILGITTIIFAYTIRFLLRLPSQRLTWINYQLDPYETAFLGGNQRRLIHTAVVSLLEKGYVTMAEATTGMSLIRSQKFCFNGEIMELTEPIEKFVAQKILDLDGQIREVLSLNLPANITNPMQQKLEQYGLIVTREQALKAQIYPVIMMTGLLTIGLIRLMIGIANHKPVNYLIMCLFGFFVVGITLFLKPHRSRYGDKFLLDLSIKERTNLLNPNGNNSSNLLLTFALLGPIAISRESAFADLYQVLRPPSNSSDMGSSDGDGGSSGCGGGGGCGGCGGGGD